MSASENVSQLGFHLEVNVNFRDPVFCSTHVSHHSRQCALYFKHISDQDRHQTLYIGEKQILTVFDLLHWISFAFALLDESDLVPHKLAFSCQRKILHVQIFNRSRHSLGLQINEAKYEI